MGRQGMHIGLALGLAGVAAGCEPQPARVADGRAPVAVSSVERGTIHLRRTYSGTLEAPARFVVAPNVAGRVERLQVDLGDAVQRGQVVARLDDDELDQRVAEARAELAVARANLTMARNRLEVARRDLGRIRKLRKRGISSEAQLDAAEAEELEAEAGVEVARARAARARAALGSARVRLGYTRVEARWSGGNDERYVAERQVSAGAQVSAGTPLYSIVELDPLICVIFVAERDYALLRADQPAVLETDAWPGERFEARVRRVAPVFEPGSRQARIELAVENEDMRLKPGMFARVNVTLKTVEDAVIVPWAAVTKRDGGSGLFRVDRNRMSVRWQPVQTGIREDDRVQLVDSMLQGEVVVLGQQLLDDGTAITIPDAEASELP
jgi:RND family efflux transporter MFP subunit